MRYYEILNEKSVVLDPERDMVVFENPSHAELLKLVAQFGSLRGASGPDLPLYVWDANMWVHHTIGKYLGHMPYYLYFSKTRGVNAEEWRREMKRIGTMFVGVKFSLVDDRNREIPRPDIPLSYPPIKRALGL